MTDDLRTVLARAAELYDEDVAARPDEEWQAEVAEVFLGLVYALRTEPSAMGNTVMLHKSWFAKVDTYEDSDLPTSPV